MSTTKRWLPVVALAASVAAMGLDCPTIPKLEERIVELAMGGTTVVPFQASGIINVYDDTETINLSDEIDLAALVDDAGVDLSDVKSVRLAGVSYRVSVADPNPGRSIDDGTVTIQRQGGAVTPLVTDFDQVVVSATGPFKLANLDAAGVAVLNQILADLLTAVQNGTALVNPGLTYTVSGTSNPQGQSTSFEWELKVDLTIVGTVKVDVLD
jgi:hypothetical protein